LSSIIILDTQDYIIAELSNDGSDACPYFEDIDHEKTNDSYRTFEFKVPANHVDSSYIVVNNKVIRPDDEGRMIYYIIKEVEDEESNNGTKIKTVICHSGHLELLGYPVRPIKLTAVTIETALFSFLQGTRWDVGIVEWSGVKDVNIDRYMNAIEAIHLLRDLYGAEVVFRVEFDGPVISKRYIDFLQTRGENIGKVIEYTQDLRSMTRTESTMPTCTALIGVGKADTNGNYLTFKNESAADKPVGQDWVGNEEAREQFGIDGQHYTLYYFNDEDITATELLAKTRIKLAEVSKPSLSYNITIADLEKIAGLEHEKIRIGDVLTVKDFTFSPPVLVEARVLEIMRSYSDPSKNEVKIGNYRTLKTDISSYLQKFQQVLLKEQVLWSETGVKMVKSVMPPSDTSVQWLDSSKSEAPFDILKTYNLSMQVWEPTAPTTAGQIGAETPTGASNKAAAAEQNAKDYTDSQLVGYVNAVTYDQDISSIQNQIDGNISSFFNPYNPTLSNAPASEWTTNSMKDVHLGDLFYNTTNGYAWRFAYESGAYKWIEVKDTDVQKALADAAKAQDTADSKRRTFVVQPIPPYDVGDLWTQGNAVYRAKTTKATGGVFAAVDWELVGDVTSQNTAADTAKVGGTPATDIAPKDYVDISDFGGAHKVFNNPAAVSGGSATTGAMVIKTPITMSSFMTRIDLSGYNYTDGLSEVDFSVGFYAYSGGTFLNKSFTSKGSKVITRARLAKESSGKVVLIVGDVADVWQYPKISVDRAHVGFSTVPNTFKDGWSIAFETTLAAYTNITEVTGRDLEDKKSAQKKADDAEQAAKTFAENASNIKRGILDVAAVMLHTAPNGARITFDGVNGIVQWDAAGNVVAQLGLDGTAKFAGDISGAKGTFTGALSTLQDILVGRNISMQGGGITSISWGGIGKVIYDDTLKFFQIGDVVVGGVDAGKAPEVHVPGLVSLRQDIKMTNGYKEKGFCSVGAYDHNTTGTIASVGVNFKAVKSVAPSSITLSPLPGSTANVGVTDITTHGFRLYIWGANSNIFREFKGTYEA
jgi:phage minor structural protein